LVDAVVDIVVVVVVVFASAAGMALLSLDQSNINNE